MKPADLPLKLTLFSIALIGVFTLNVASVAGDNHVKFSSDPSNPDWRMLSPVWTHAQGRLDGSGVTSLSPKIESTGTFSSDRTFNVKFRTLIQGSQDWYAAWMVGKYVSEFNRTGVILHNSGILEMFVSELGSTGLVDHLYTTPTSLNNLDWHELKIVYTGSTAQVSVDGVVYLTVTDSIIGELGACHIELASWGNSESTFSNVSVRIRTLDGRLDLVRGTTLSATVVETER